MNKQIIKPFSRGVIGFSSTDEDCSVRAAANAAKIEYSKAHEVLARHGRNEGKGAFTPTIAKAYTELGFKLEGVFGSSKSAMTDKALLIGILGQSKVKHYAGMTLQRFIDGKLKGSYICCTNNHAFAVIDGKLIDTTNLLGNSRITFIFKV